jgi:hypothetical protein
MNWSYVLFASISSILSPLISRHFKLYEELDGIEELKQGGAWHLIRTLLRLAPIFSLALLGHYWLQRLGNSKADVIHAILLDVLYIVPLFLVLVPVVGRFNRRYGRAKVETRISVIVLFGFVLPAWIHQANVDSSNARRAAAVQKLIDLEIELRASWIADIKAAGAHGPAGQVPPMIHVEANGESVELANLAGRDICLRIAGVSPAAPGGAVVRCDFQAFAERSSCLVVPASRSLTFTPKRSACLARPLEFKIGDVEHDEVGWWSDSALSDLVAATDRLRSNLGVFDYREMSDARLREEVSRLEAQKAGEQRAEEWRKDLEFWTRMRN